MTHKMAIKLIRTHKNLTRKKVAENVGVDSTAEALFARLNSSNTYIKDLVDIFDGLGYQLVFRPKRKETLPERCYPIRLSDYNIK